MVLLIQLADNDRGAEISRAEVLSSENKTAGLAEEETLYSFSKLEFAR